MSNEIKPVTIPREVADAIESLRGVGRDNESLIYAVINPTGDYNDTLTHLRSIPFDTLMCALLNGYERELTEEEARYRDIADEYEEYVNGLQQYETEAEDYAYADGIKFTLDKLGIVIPGVNDSEVNA